MNPKSKEILENPPIDEAQKKLLFKYFPAGIVVFDLETTGLSPLMDKIIEIGAIKITPSKIEGYQELVYPEQEIPEASTKIHGITDSMVKDGPTIESALPQFLNFCGELPLLAHNAQFDIGHVMANVYQHNFDHKNNPVFCSCKLARERFQLPSHRLSELSKHFNIQLINHHRASDDALAALFILLKALEKGSPSKAFLYELNDFKNRVSNKLPQEFKPLFDYLPEQKLLMIKYAGGSRRGIWRPIRPVSLLPLPKGVVLYAHCLLDDLYKNFYLTKLKELRPPSSEELDLYPGIESKS